MSANNQTVILHISDLHFGWDGQEKERTDRKLVLKGLQEQICSLESDWAPNHICITGDIGWRGKSEDYEEAKQWIEHLLEVLSLSPQAVFLCPGNHDLARHIARSNARPNAPDEADQVLGEVPIPDHFQKPFGAFIDFCESLSIPPYSIGDLENYLVGQRSFGELHFVSCNSAWFSKGDDDRGKLWVGLPQLKHLESKGQLPSPTQLHEGPITIVLLHHPKEWFHEAELQAQVNRPNTFDYLSRRSHLLLTGHTHGEVRKADQFSEGAWHLSGGAGYAGAGHCNSFRLIRIEDDGFVYRSFEFDPQSADNVWRPRDGAQPLPFRQVQESSSYKGKNKATSNLLIYREKSLADAKRLIETKSRVLKPSGTLPETLPLNVSVHVRGQRHQFSEGQLSEDPKTQIPMPLFDASRQSQRTLLLGDLGSGKSTLAGMFVIKTLEENSQSLSCIIPAKVFDLQQSDTVKDVLRVASKYFNEQISPTTPPLSIEELLSQRVETSLVIDGLDEVSTDRAALLRRQLGALVDHWPYIQIVATGRPVELLGVNYENWKVLTTVALDDNERLQLLKAEILAAPETEPDTDAEETAKQLLQRIKATPVLDSLAVTPLVLRLLYSRLRYFQSERTLTLGDLLYEVLKERLGQWATKDGKQSTTPIFDEAFPDESSRARLLGNLALHLETHKSLQLDEARAELEILAKCSGDGNEKRLANEALQFYLQTGLLLKSEYEFQFPSQPLYEFLCSYGLTFGWLELSDQMPQLERQQWRIISFAATIIRKLGRTENFRHRIVAFLQKLLSDESGVPAAAYITGEFQDEACALAFIEGLKSLGPRPLTFFSDDHRQSSLAIAESIKLAGQEGFNWFFDQYLDPRYPTVNTGSKLIDDVFRQWAHLSLDKITAHERMQLSTMVRPHIDAGTHQLLSIIPLLTLLTPEKFETKERLWFVANFLRDNLLATRAEENLRAAFESDDNPLVNQVLIGHAQTGYGNAAYAAWLWMSLNEDQPPPIIVKALIRTRGNSGAPAQLDQHIAHCIQRIGNSSWKALCRWYLFDSDSHLAGGAAIELWRCGERHLSILGKPLLGALHDGGYVRQAEEILSSLIADNGTQAVKWLAGQIIAMERESTGARSGLWRLFLSSLPQLDREGPELLAKSLGAVGCFLLPRYPEIRQLFQDLLSGTDGPLYHKTLQERLHDANPAIRHGAAMVLVVSDPANENFALEVVVQSRSRQSYASWREWERFCLSLAFGPSTLAYLKSKLPLFDSSAAIFALVILYRNKIPLNEAQHEILVKGLTSWKHTSLYTEEVERSVLENPVSFQILLQYIEKYASSEAAAKLLQYYQDRLSLLQRALCDNLIWNLADLQQQIRRIEHEPAYAEAVKKTAAQLVEQGGRRPLLDLFREALTSEEAWEDIVWRLLCDDSGLALEKEDIGQWLLDYGRTDSRHGVPIGKVAGKFLHDPRLQVSRWTEAPQWLAILSDEFIGVSQSEMRETLLRKTPIFPSASIALLARLGAVPPGFQKRDSSIMKEPPYLDPPQTLEQDPAERSRVLKELARQAENLHPDMCSTIEALLFESQLSTEELYSLTREGINGALMVSALSFAYGQSPEPELTLRLLSYRPMRDQAQNRCSQHLFRAWREGTYKLQTELANRGGYMEALEKVFSSGPDEVSAIAAEVLRMGGDLSPIQIPLVFDHLAQHPEYFDYGLGGQLIAWLCSGLPPHTQVVLTEALERGIAALDGHPWNLQGQPHIDALPFLLFPAVYWSLTGTTNEASFRVFLRGLKFSFSQQSSEEGLATTIAQIEPILSKAPKKLLEEAILFGQTVDDSAVRSLCRFFSSHAYKGDGS